MSQNKALGIVNAVFGTTGLLLTIVLYYMYQTVTQLYVDFGEVINTTPLIIFVVLTLIASLLNIYLAIKAFKGKDSNNIKLQFIMILVLIGLWLFSTVMMYLPIYQIGTFVN